MVQHLTVFGVLMLIVCMAFSSEHILFAWSDPHYNSMTSALHELGQRLRRGELLGDRPRQRGHRGLKLLSVLYLLIVVLLLMNLLIALLSEQTVKTHERSAKYWCFVQLGMILRTSARASWRSSATASPETSGRFAVRSTLASDFGVYGEMLDSSRRGSRRSWTSTARGHDRDDQARGPRLCAGPSSGSAVAAAILKKASEAPGAARGGLPRACRRLLDAKLDWPGYDDFVRCHNGGSTRKSSTPRRDDERGGPHDAAAKSAPSASRASSSSRPLRAAAAGRGSARARPPRGRRR